MFRLALCLLLACTACGPVEQPEWAKTVSAYEVPLPTDDDKRRFLKLLTDKANAAGFHVDSATTEDLKVTPQVSPQTFNAAVWRGRNDDEPIASAMDFQDHIGRVWISFSLGRDPPRSTRFKEELMLAIKKDWPDTMSLPITPGGGIPLAEDLIRTPTGYAVRPDAASKYRK